MMDLVTSTNELPIFTPTRLFAPSETLRDTTNNTSQQSGNPPVVFIATTITIVLLIILGSGIGICFYYRRLKRNKESMEINEPNITSKEDRRNKKNNTTSRYSSERQVDPQVPLNREVDSILLEFSSLGGGMKPPPTTALPPIPMDARLSIQSKRPLSVKRPISPPTRTLMEKKTISLHLPSSSIMNPEDFSITKPTPVEISSSSKPTQTKTQKETTKSSKTQILSSTSSTISTFNSGFETSFIWDDSADKIYETDSNLSSKWFDNIDSPTLPQHSSIWSVTTKKSSGFVMPQSWSKASWQDEEVNEQSETEIFDQYFSSAS